jgi:RNA polymerase sigma-70 factor (ECF subfamily)
MERGEGGMHSETELAAQFTQHRARLRRLVAFRLHPQLQGRLDLEDVLQDAYLAAAQRLPHFVAADPPVAPFVWLRTIVLQTLTDACRHHLGAQKRDVFREVSLEAGENRDGTSAAIALQLAGDLTSPSQAAARADAMTVVRNAIGGMDELDREVLALRHFEELSNQEVAEALGIEQKAASIRYIRALRRLRALLAELTTFGGGLARG